MRLILLSILIILSLISNGQDSSLVVNGVVLDSASLQPLPYTSLQIKGTNHGQSTNEDGSFTFNCNKGDTLVFSRLGHKVVLYIAYRSESVLKIFLPEDAKLLKEITVYDNYEIAGLKEAKKSLPANSNIQLKSKSIEPAPNAIETFGPTIGIRLGGKNDKTKNKRDDLAKTSVFRCVITSPETKKQLTEMFSISEEVYNHKLEKFNKENPEVAYLTDKDEIVTMLIQFFALK